MYYIYLLYYMCVYICIRIHTHTHILCAYMSYHVFSILNKSCGFHMYIIYKYSYKFQKPFMLNSFIIYKTFIKISEIFHGNIIYISYKFQYHFMLISLILSHDFTRKFMQNSCTLSA